MKKITFSLLTLLTILPAAAYANEPTPAAKTQQQCSTDADCKLVSNLNQPISGSCVNARCQINVASSDADYKSGAYGVPEAPVANKVPPSAYQGVDDRKGNFTAYDLPQQDVKEGTVGTIYDRVYVPPSAPVSGGNYVPVGQAPVAPAAPAVMPPAAVPTQAIPAAPVPTAPPPAAATPAYVPQAATQTAPAVPATPTTTTYATPTGVPVMKPSLPNQQVPAAPPVPVPAPVQAPTTYVAPDPQPTGPAIPSVGATGVPVAPPGSTPIPPSDLKPVPTFVPPAGGTIPVNPEDPGAPPPEGSTIMMKDGNLGMSTTDTSKADKDFGATPKSEAKTKKLGSFN